MIHIVRYITQHDLDAYRHWRVTYYGERGDGLSCFIASWRCTRESRPTSRRPDNRE